MTRPCPSLIPKPVEVFDQVRRLLELGADADGLREAEDLDGNPLYRRDEIADLVEIVTTLEELRRAIDEGRRVLAGRYLSLMGEEAAAEDPLRGWATEGQMATFVKWLIHHAQNVADADREERELYGGQS